LFHLCNKAAEGDVWGAWWAIDCDEAKGRVGLEHDVQVFKRFEARALWWIDRYFLVAYYCYTTTTPLTSSMFNFVARRYKFRYDGVVP
jgi:hypothetical protein